MTADSFNPRYQYDTTTWTLPQIDRISGAAKSLAGLTTANILLKLQLIEAPHTVISLTGGTIAIASPSTAGIITYHPVVGDVSTPGAYDLWTFIQWTGTDWSRGDPYTVVIQASPVAP
jgi:hypothetical protein